jgi:hypothetical protein
MDSKYNTACLDGCSPAQVLNISMAINDISVVEIFNNCDCKYDKSQLQYAYSLDNICWTCYMSYNDILKSTVNLKQDFYVRIKIPNTIGYISINDIISHDYTTQLFQGFDFKLENCGSITSNTFNPYANLDCAISLQTQISETVACMFGVPIYYFKLSPNEGSKDITFKEYTLMDVESVKQIKLIIKDGQMPSSKPEFAEFGLDWQNDWETEISKGMFATAFGINAQPMEGDLIYIPMMKRMWMVNGSYEEKNDSLMWNSTTFRVTLVKYQEKGSVDLGDAESLVDSFVKNKYEDLFGDEENIDSGFDSVEAPLYSSNNLYPVFESDSTRKYVSCNNVNIVPHNTYYKNTLISDSKYEFTNSSNQTIVYQRQYCGKEGACSFIFCANATLNNILTKIIEIGDLKIIVEQNTKVVLYLNKCPDNKLILETGKTYLVIFRWSKVLNYAELSAFAYTYNQNVPKYKLSPAHVYYDIDNPSSKQILNYSIELEQEKKKDVLLNSINGWITNIKLFDVYIDDITTLMQMYPTHQHLIINDTARKLLDLPGVALK